MPRSRKPKSAFTYVLQVWFSSLVLYPITLNIGSLLHGKRPESLAGDFFESFAFTIVFSAPHFLFLCASVPAIARRSWRIAVKKFMVVVTALLGTVISLSLFFGLILGWDWAVSGLAMNGTYLVVLTAAVCGFRWPGRGEAEQDVGEHATG